MHGQSTGEERRHLAAVEQDLVREFPDLTPAQVHDRFEAVVHGFDGAPIRDFVPVLARRRAVDELQRTAKRTTS